MDLADLEGEAELIPDSAFYIHARPVRTERGFHLISARGGERSALIIHSTGTSSHGRHGRSGEDVLPAKTNRAPAASATGMSGGGGQTRAVIIAVVSEETPLLLTDGSGITVRAGRTVTIPGLASGTPGDPRPYK